MINKPKKKRGFLLIRNSSGTIDRCFHCSSKHVAHVLHLNIEWTDLGVYKNDMTNPQRSALRKAYPKQCDELFVCQKCYGSLYRLNGNYILDTRQYSYTSLMAESWDDREWVTLAEAVEQFS